MKNKIAKAIYESTAYSMIQSAKINLDNQTTAIIVGKLSKPSIEMALTAQIENYLNALEYACSLYFSHDIDEKRFIILYSSDVKNIFESNAYKEAVNLNAFINLGRFYKLIKATEQKGKKQ